MKDKMVYFLVTLEFSKFSRLPIQIWATVRIVQYDLQRFLLLFDVNLLGNRDFHFGVSSPPCTEAAFCGCSCWACGRNLSSEGHRFCAEVEGRRRGPFIELNDDVREDDRELDAAAEVAPLFLA